jgi:chemotaxis signal transduction protein
VLRVQGGDNAVPINRVPEITRVPPVQADVQGVNNLRGRVLAVVYLSLTSALGVTERARSARVVVVDGAPNSSGSLWTVSPRCCA